MRAGDLLNITPSKGPHHRIRTILWILAGSVFALACLAVGLVAGLRFAANDTQRARWATAALAGVTPGRIAIGSLHWELPAILALRDVSVGAAGAGANGAALISARKLDAELEVGALLRRRIALKHVRVQDANVTMTQPGAAQPFDLVTAFAGHQDVDPPTAPSGEPWMVSIDDIALERVAYSLVDPELRVSVTDATLHEGAFWLRGDAMGITATLRGALAVHAGAMQLQLDEIGVVVDQGVWTVHGDDVDIGVRRVRAEAQGNVVDVTGDVQLTPSGLRNVDARADLKLDSAAPLWQKFLPAVLKKQVRGKALLQVHLKGDEQSLAYDVDMGSQPNSPSILLGQTRLDHLQVAGTFASPVLTVKHFELHSGDARVEADGHVDVLPKKPIILGKHALNVKAHALPLAQALAPFVSGSDMMPRQVDLALNCAGASLWPPRTTASLQMTARDMPKKLVGVPDPLQVDSKFQGQGDKIHIEHFQLHGDGTDFSLEGDIPLKPDGVMDVLSQLKHLKSGKTLKRFKVPMGAREVRLRTRLTGTFVNPHAEGMLWADDLSTQDHTFQVRAPFVFVNRRLRLQHAILTLDDGHADINGEVSLAGREPQVALQATLQKVAVAASGFPLTGQIDGEVAAQGALSAPVAHARIMWRDAGWQQGSARAEVSLVAHSDKHGMHVEALDIAPSSGGKSHVQGDVHWDKRELDITWDAADITAQWLARAAGASPDLAAHGALRAQGHVRGPWADPRGEAHITLEKAGIAAVELGDVVIGLHGDAQQVVSTVTLAPHHSHLALETTLWLPRPQHPMRVAGTARLQPVWLGDLLPELAARAADVKLAGEGHWWWNPHAGFHASAEIAELDAHVANKTMSLERPAHIRWSDGEASVDDMHLRGDLAALWVRGRWGKQVNGQVDGKLDLRVLSDFVPTFGSAEGTVELALRVDGTPAQPDAHGKVHVTSPVVVRLRQVPGEIYVDRGLIALTPKGLVISDWRGRYGFGALQVDGHVDLQDFKPKSYDVRLHATDIPCRTPELLLEANADVQVTGAGAQPMLTGKIDITRGRFIKRFDLHDFYVQAKPGAASVALKDKAPGLEGVGLDVHVGTSNDLVVNVDAGIFAVKTDLQANLHVTGNVVYPKINGSLHAEGGTLKFPEAALALTEANLDFTPGAGHAIDAKVHMLGEGTVTSSGPSSQAYAVTLQLDGDLDKMLLDLRATPDRTRLEVLSLLTTGHADLSELVQQSPDDNKLNAALVFAGSQVSEPVTRYASAQIERYAKLKVDLGAQVTQDAVTLTASKQVMSRLRLQGAYQHGIATDSAAVVAGAQVALTDQLFFEGTQTLPTNNANTVDNYAQGSLQLKWRLLGH